MYMIHIIRHLTIEEAYCKSELKSMEPKIYGTGNCLKFVETLKSKARYLIRCAVLCVLFLADCRCWETDKIPHQLVT